MRAGAFNPFNSKKLMRGLEIARENRMPYVQSVESAGADLRGASGEGQGDPNVEAEADIQRDIEHFAESGRLFYEISELSKLRIPTVSVIFGAATAGGAYQPGMSDYNIMVKNQAMVSLGGPPLVKMATGEDADAESLGGADMHTQISGLGDYLAQDEMDGIRICREVVSHWLAQLGPEPKRLRGTRTRSEDLLGMVSKDLKSPLDIREVIMRIVDGSLFEEFKPLYGPSVVCGWASIHGYPIGILGNNGAVSESAKKRLSSFSCAIRLMSLYFSCTTSRDSLAPTLSRGITKNGSKMVNRGQLYGTHYRYRWGLLWCGQLWHERSRLWHEVHLHMAPLGNCRHGTRCHGRCHDHCRQRRSGSSGIEFDEEPMPSVLLLPRSGLKNAPKVCTPHPVSMTA